MRATSARIWTRSLASRFESGSSIRKTLGSRTIARPIATRWRWPPESCRGLRSSSDSSPSERPICSTRGRISGSRHPARAEPEGDVVEHRHVRVERVVLEDHRDVALPGARVVDAPVADQDLALGHRLEPGDHPERGRLSAAGRPDEARRTRRRRPRARSRRARRRTRRTPSSRRRTSRTPWPRALSRAASSVGSMRPGDCHYNILVLHHPAMVSSPRFRLRRREDVWLPTRSTSSLEHEEL